MGPEQASDPNAMPLKDFIDEVMQILKTSPATTEICVERVKRLRFAEANDYDALFRQRKDSQSRYQFRVEPPPAAKLGERA